ncbi:hypothetical protein CCACVL1_15809 [Corchorus capsularis]|nr:hypothetical protein CCACVL1_15809 [Corchorus capsularis]
MVEMRVHMDCEGCATKIKKALGKLKGIDSVDIDMDIQKVTVIGWAAADQKKILKTVRRTGRRAELWPYPYNPQNQFYYEYYQSQPITSSTTTYHAKGGLSSYNYYKHGYDGHDHGYYQPPPYSTLVDEEASAVFSDENPHACSIM